jgi:hypothetical protein
MTKKAGVSRRSSIIGWRVGQAGKRGQIEFPSVPERAGPTVKVSSSRDIRLPMNMNHKTHHTVRAKKMRMAYFKAVWSL